MVNAKRLLGGFGRRLLLLATVSAMSVGPASFASAAPAKAAPAKTAAPRHATSEHLHRSHLHVLNPHGPTRVARRSEKLRGAHTARHVVHVGGVARPALAGTVRSHGAIHHRLAIRGAVSGTVVGPKGHAVGGAKVHLVSTRAAGRGRHRVHHGRGVRTDARGAFHIRGVRPHHYRVAARKRGVGRGSSAVAVAAAAPAKTVTVQLHHHAGRRRRHR